MSLKKKKKKEEKKKYPAQRGYNEESYIIREGGNGQKGGINDKTPPLVCSCMEKKEIEKKKRVKVVT